MKYLVSKIAITIACLIILLHAAIPHHHHDCEAGHGIIFETEINCGCESECVPAETESHHHSHHPFDICKLQDLLSQLVLSERDDESLFCHHCIDLYGMPPIGCDEVYSMPATELALMPWTANRLPIPPGVATAQLRAPPLYV